LRLFTADGRVLKEFHVSLKEAGLQDGDTLIAVVPETKLAATQGASSEPSDQVLVVSVGFASPHMENLCMGNHHALMGSVSTRRPPR